MSQNFYSKLNQIWQSSKSLLTVGLDPEVEKIPHGLELFDFLKEIIRATAPYACSFKPQFAHFAAIGKEKELAELCQWIKTNYPHHILILDAKRGDVLSTAKKYSEEAFKRYAADAVTLNPYLGMDSLTPFLEIPDKGSIVLVRTSNPGAKDFQNLLCNGEALYLQVAKTLSQHNQNKNLCFVVGATYPEEMKQLRQLYPEIPFLVPGVGAQGGDPKAVLSSGADTRGRGLLVNSSRGILYKSSNPKDFAQAAAEEAKSLSKILSVS